MPELIEREIERRVVLQNPFRNLVKVVRVGRSRTETTTSDLVEVAPSFGTIYSRPKASEEAVADIFFDVGEWLVSEVADSFSAAVARAIWNGNGSNRPSGLINTTPSSTADLATFES